MRIRTLLQAAIALSVVAGFVTAAAVFDAARRERAASEIQARAQFASHEVTGLLTLTEEFARHMEQRAAFQWYRRQRAIVRALDVEEALRPSPAASGLRAVAQSLPELFDRLERLPRSDADPFATRRREAVLDELITSTQAMSDYADRWFREAADVREESARRFRLLAFAAPFVMLALIAALAELVRQRVLLPVRALGVAASALGAGDMTTRLGSHASDELGDLSRRFDAMTAALAESSERARRSAQQLQAVTDNLPTLIAHVGTDRRYRFANQQYRRLSGVRPERLIGEPVETGWGIEMRTLFAPHLDAVLAGTRQRFEHVGLLDGRTAWLQVDYIPDVDEHGAVAGFYAMAADVTERREAEAKLRESEGRLRAITDHLPAMIGHFDADERCLFANPLALKVHGMTPAQALGSRLSAGISASAYAQHRPHIEAVLRGEPRRFEGHDHRRGRDVHFDVQLVPDRAADGSARGFFLMTVDVTAVRQAERARARSEERLRQITDNLPVLISYIDRDERLCFANATFRHWLGIEPDAVVGGLVKDSVRPETYEKRHAYIRRALAGERVEFEGQAREVGVLRDTHTIYVPDVDADGIVQGLYALTTDVSRQKEVARQLQALAHFDTLTGLPNRLHYNEKLPLALERLGRSGDALALMFLDIDHFKSINDSLGHAAGDTVLKEFSKRLKESVRLTDTVVRLAGDEFVVILEGLHGPAEANRVADKIVAAMAPPFAIGERLLSVTTSVGIACHDAWGGQTTPGALLGRADKALYEAKSAGRNRYHRA